MKRPARIAALLGCVLHASAALGGDESSPADPAEQIVRIAYATNRAVLEGESGTDRFGDDAGPVTYGVCHVAFEPIGFLKDAARHITLRIPTELEDVARLEPLDGDAFWDRFKSMFGEGDPSVALYVHGYKMDFDKACRRTALLKRRLGPEVELLLFAWPSQDNFALYTRDETLLKASIADIRTVLKRMLSLFGAGRVDVVAHSLGSRGASSAVAGVQSRDAPRFGELVLVAPDMNRFDFEKALPALSRNVTGVTIYASDYDGPLRVSEEVHGAPRLGQAGEHLTLYDGVETIDISNAPRRDIYGHNYHYFNGRIAGDMQILLSTGARAGLRPGLMEKRRAGRTYWEMTSEQ
jgi:pimeloyl-ACP methyl ester carboxylesterase